MSSTRSPIRRELIIWSAFYVAWLVLGVLVYRYVVAAEILRGFPRPAARFVMTFGVSAYIIGLISVLPVLTSRLAPFRRDRWIVILFVHLLVAGVFAVLHAWLSGLVMEQFRPPSPRFGMRPGPGGIEDRMMFMMSRGVGIAVVGYWMIVGVTHALDSSRKLRERELHASQLEAQLATAQLRSLKDQVHPHFLFNALNTVSSLVHDDPNAADKMIRDLSELLRLVVDRAADQTILLSEELRFVDLYLDIMKTRYPDKVTLDRNIPEEVLSTLVPDGRSRSASSQS